MRALFMRPSPRIRVLKDTSAVATLVTLRNVINFTGDAAGDVYESWWDFEVSDTKNLALIAAASGATTTMPITAVNANSNYPDGSQFAGVARTAAASPNPSSPTNQPAAVVSSGSLTNISSAFQISFPAGVECGGTFTVAAPFLGRVPADE